MNNGQNPTKILVLRYRYIGDTLLTIPFLRALRGQFPQAEITLCVGADGFPVVAHCPYVDRVEVLEPKDKGFWKTVQWMKAQGFDRVYLLKRSFGSALMAFLAGIPQRIGFNTEGRGFLLTQGIAYRPNTQHEAQCYLDLLGGGPGQASDLALETWTSPEADASAHSLLSALPPAPLRVVIHATSTNNAKCWPLVHFAQLAEWLIERHGAQILLIGPPAEASLYEVFINLIPLELRGSCHNLCGQTPVEVSLAMLKSVQLVVANDSGMSHMAAAQGTPVVSVFGPSAPEQWRPLSNQATVVTHGGLTCQPCRMTIRCEGRYTCLSDLAPQKVYDACLAYLKP